MNWLVGLISCTGLLLTSRAAAQSPDATPALKPVATLECTASRLRDRPTGTKLACTLRADHKAGETKYEGEMYGEALYLLAPNDIRVSWKVSAHTQSVKAQQLEGDYDRVSRHGLAYPRNNRKVLMGGKDDLVALELVAPVIEGLDASTFLTLRSLP